VNGAEVIDVVLCAGPGCDEPVVRNGGRGRPVGVVPGCTLSSRSTTSRHRTTSVQPGGSGSSGCGEGLRVWTSRPNSDGRRPTFSRVSSMSCSPPAGGRREPLWSRTNHGARWGIT